MKLAFLIILMAVPLMAQEDEDRAAENRKVLEQLPDSPAKRILSSNCVECHSLARVAAGHKTVGSWKNTIQVMVVNGAKLPDEEVAPLAEYLGANFGLPVNINRASAADLAKVRHLDDKLAEAIVAYREKNGPFTKVEELTKIEGFSPELLGKVQNRLTVGILQKKPE